MQNKSTVKLISLLTIVLSLFGGIFAYYWLDSNTAPTKSFKSIGSRYFGRIGGIDDPNSASWQQWGTKITKEQADELLAFKLKLPPEGSDSLSGKIEAIIVEGRPTSESKADNAYVFLAEGIRVNQRLIAPDEPDPPSKLEDYGVGSEQYNEEKEVAKNVDINGITGIGREPAYKEENGGVYRSLGGIDWYIDKERVFYQLGGNNKIPLNELVEIARLFNLKPEG